MAKTFHVIIEQDEDSGYIGKVPELKGCLSQGDTLDELMKNIKEAIELCLEVEEKRNIADDAIIQLKSSLEDFKNGRVRKFDLKAS